MRRFALIGLSLLLVLVLSVSVRPFGSTMNSSTAQAASNVVFNFSQVVTPVGDQRQLAVAFHSINFLDQNASSLGQFLFGTSQAFALEGQGWYAAEQSDPGLIQWAGGPSMSASLQLQIPSGTESLLLNISSIVDSLSMNVTVDGRLVATLRVDAYWHSGYVPIADTSVIPPTGAPVWTSGQYFPSFPASDRMYVIYVSSGLEDWWGKPSSPDFQINSSYQMMMALTLVGMQGVINRNGSCVYLEWNDAGKYGNSSAFWVPYLQTQTRVTYLDLDPLSAVNFLFRRFWPRFAGAVVYDPAVPDTINLATMLAGLENRIMLAPEQVGMQGMPAFGSVMDLRTLENAYGWNNSAQGVYSIYKWAYDKLWPSLDHRIIGVISPGPPTSGAISDSQDAPIGLGARDYIVALRLTALWLSPVDDPQKGLFAQYLNDSPSPIPVLGFWENTEVQTVAFVSSYGDWCPAITINNNPEGSADLSALSGVRPSLEQYQAGIDTDDLFATLGGGPVATVFSSDGDAINFQMDRGYYGLPDFVWNQVQGNNFGWSINPTLADLAPTIWNYYMDSRSGVSFISGLSGAGYCYPASMNDSQLRAYLTQTGLYLARTGLRTVWVDDRPLGWPNTFWEDVAPLYYEYLHDSGYLGAIVSDYGFNWGLNLEYGGVPTPGVRQSYALNMTNGAWIIDDLLNRRSDQVFIDMASYPWQGGIVVNDTDALSGQSVLFSQGAPTFGTYGPVWMSLAPGNYTAVYRLKVTDNQPTAPVASLLVTENSTSPVTLAQRTVSSSDFDQPGKFQDFTVNFTLGDLSQGIQIKMTYYNSTNLYIDYINTTRDESLNFPVFAAIQISLVQPGQSFAETPQFAGDLQRAGGVVLSPDEFMAALNPEFMMQWATPILGPGNPALALAQQQLAQGLFFDSLLTVRNALLTLPDRTYLLQAPAVAVEANAWVTNLTFDQGSRLISFRTHRPPAGAIQTSVAVPAGLLPAPLLLSVDGENQSYTISQNATYATIVFQLSPGPHLVEISTATPIPEFPASLPFFTVFIGVLMAVLVERRLGRHQNLV
jgi:hypothetical protein